jgi:YHYH protein
MHKQAAPYTVAMTARTTSFIATVLLTTALSAPSQAHDTARTLPLGDGKVSAQPKQGYVMACNSQFRGGGGAHRVGDWIHNGRWNPQAKPTVEGQVAWPNARISVALEGSDPKAQRVVSANNLPTHASGEFPIRPGSTAFDYDRNPHRITERSVLLRLPAQPQVAAQPGCVPMGMVGFALSGVAIFNAFDLAGRDAPAYEIQDACNGHPERNGSYHYHDYSPCLKDTTGDAGQHSAVVGYMLDGFAIFGLKGEGGKELTNADLDECHGHSHAVEIDGEKRVAYHYHFTREYPYSIGCFKGVPQNSNP